LKEPKAESLLGAFGQLLQSGVAGEKLTHQKMPEKTLQ
jgi:hypothetical protein